MSISNAEWEIMRVVWTKEETTSSQILEILEQKTDWTASTVKTLLKRLVDKGYLATQKSGKSFLYSTLVSEEEAINRQADELFDKFCQRKHTAIIKHLLETTPMTMADITICKLCYCPKKKRHLKKCRAIASLGNVAVKSI